MDARIVADLNDIVAELQVKSEHGSTPDDPARFNTTRWSAVLVAAQSQLPGSQAALTELCRLYWYPLYAFARRRGYGPPDAQDLTQGFFLHLLERRALKHVQPLKGKFRSFLLASFQNFILDEVTRARCLKRGGNREFVFLDAEDAESRYRLEPADCLTAEKIYDAREEMSRFDVLQGFVGVGKGKPPPSYEEVAKSLRVSVGAAKTLIHRFRNQYAAILREEIARTVTNPADIEQEIHALCEALVAAEGRL